MNQRPYEKLIRLAVVVPYYLFNLPLFVHLLFPNESEPLRSGAEMYLIWMLIACLLVYLVLELVEFLAFGYKKQGRWMTLALTGIRLAAWILSVIVSFLLPEIPVYDLLIPFFVLSLYFVFPVRISFPIMLASTGYAVLMFFLREAPVLTKFSYFMLIPRILNIFILYAFAYFWENTRKRREENEALVKRLHAFADGVGRQVALDERTRLALDIHDNLGHSMTVIQIQLNKAEAFFDRDPEGARSSIVYARDAAREAMTEIRQSLDTLNNPGGGFFLKGELSRLIQPLEKNGLAVRFEFRGGQEGYNYAVLLAVFRMVQEGVTNILKHAAARSAGIFIDMGSESGTARVEDDGIGIPGGKDPPAGYGLTGLANRLTLVQGRFNVTPRPGGGTILAAEFPRDPVKIIRGVPE
jgi:signal transduction histidine kinase